MRTVAGADAGALTSADASSDASTSDCAYAGTNASAYTSADVSPYASTNAGPSPASTPASTPAPIADCRPKDGLLERAVFLADCRALILTPTPFATPVTTTGLRDRHCWRWSQLCAGYGGRQAVRTVHKGASTSTGNAASARAAAGSRRAARRRGWWTEG